ncbi:heterokaryon incompatibility protein-domain-containing protein [Cadophora sp. MPI-SDFR-AT-0126]|nr:heterokaryon incompatibility protein-domain-containing protein [Leotiomycetes sp. MPI-SDFR-AT-0126]
MDPISSRTRSTTSKKYVYSSLNDPGSEIRVIVLPPGQGLSADIKCTLEVALLASPPEYFALSYAWGKDEPTHQISIDKCKFLVTENLLSALRHLICESQPQKIWVDAICINQEDNAEKSQQVQQMAQIYSKAIGAIVWLGDAYEDSGLAFDTLERLSSMSAVLRTLEAHPSDQPLDRDWALRTILDSEILRRDNKTLEWLEKNIRKDISWLTDNQVDMEGLFGTQALVATTRLFHRRWWKRIWIVQEFVLPRAIMFQCGNRILQLSIFEGGYFSFCSLLTRQHPRLKIQNVSVPQLWKDLGRGVSLFWLRDTHQTGRDLGERRSLLHLLYSTKTHYCKDRRDKIFALLSLANDELAELVEIDYNITTSTLYCELAAKWILLTDNLDILNCCHSTTHSNRVSGLPTWVPDWTMVRMASLISSSFQTGKRKFNASLGASFDSSLVKELNGFSEIRTEGYQFDTVNEIGIEYLPNDDEESRAITIHQWQILANQRGVSPAAFWTTVSGGNELTDVTKERAAEARSRWCFLDAEQQKWSYDLESRLLLDSAWSSLFFFSSNGFMGITRENIQIGDSICILFGAQTPFILRKQGEGYILIGECYVDGIMEGEAMKEYSEGKYKKEIFHIF